MTFKFPRFSENFWKTCPNKEKKGKSKPGTLYYEATKERNQKSIMCKKPLS